MRKYKVYYYAEQNDECCDLEIIIKCPNFWDIKEYFEKEVSRYKRVYDVKELSNL